jgi:hypothetical protein
MQAHEFPCPRRSADLSRSSPYDAEGKLDHDGILAWQHTMMYLAFGASGCVDLLGTQLKLPRGAEQVHPPPHVALDCWARLAAAARTACYLSELCCACSTPRRPACCRAGAPRAQP